MASTSRKIVTSVAWGLALSSASELVLAAAFGGWGGLGLGKKSITSEEAATTFDQTLDPLLKVVPLIAGLIGLSLGLRGYLPGTETPREIH